MTLTNFTLLWHSILSSSHSESDCSLLLFSLENVKLSIIPTTSHRGQAANGNQRKFARRVQNVSQQNTFISLTLAACLLKREQKDTNCQNEIEQLSHLSSYKWLLLCHWIGYVFPHLLFFSLRLSQYL